ncbi:MAG: hypothetical protein K6T86_06480 [Pirellulales bacterium]|nr:hypothetical protein [Pirellulales bacterium]
MDAPLEGKPPRSREEIRAYLDSLHSAQPELPPGAMQHGLPEDVPLVVATFYNRDVARRFQDRLLREGIHSTLGGTPGQWQVAVDAADRPQAAELLALHLQHDPDHVPRGPIRSFDYTLFGACIAATLAVCALGGDLRRLRSYLVVAVVGICGALVGSFIDRARTSLRRTGRMQFTLLDALATIALVALAAFLWTMRQQWRVP